MGLAERPVVLIVLCWTLGYVLAYVWGLQTAGIYMALAGIAFSALLAAAKPRGWMWLLAAVTVLTAAGWYGAYDDRNRTLIAPAAEEVEQVAFRGRLVTPVTVDGDRVSFQAVAESVKLPDAQRVGEEGGEARGEKLQVSVRLLKQEEQLMAASWRRGDRIEMTGTLKRPSEARNFGAFDYRRYLYMHHIHWQLTVKGTEAIVVTAPGRGDWGVWRLGRWNDRFRDALASKVDALFPEEQSGFMKGMLIGLTDEIDPEQFDAFSRLGLTHIIAISGLNVAIFLGCLIWLLRRIGLTRETYLWTAMGFIPLYIAATGGSPSIVRAGMMAMIGLYAAYRNRLKDGLHLAFITGLAMLAWHPYYLTDVSFQLSFLVTIGIIVLVPKVSKLLPVTNVKLRDALSITLVAQFVSFPLTIYYFNQFSLLSFAANLALVPVFSLVVMPVGTVAMLLGFVSMEAGGILAWIVEKVNGLLFAVVTWCSELRLFQTIWPSPTVGWMVFYYGGLAGLVWLGLQRKQQVESASEDSGPMLDSVLVMHWKTRLHRWNRRVLLPGAVIGLGLVLWAGYRPLQEYSRQGKVQFIDVGQGDSILIHSPGEARHILVDGGGTVSFRKPGESWKERRDPYEIGRKTLVPLLKKRGIQQIDELIVTHQDEDHFGGLQAVLEDIPVKRLLFNGTLKPIPKVKQLFETALARGTQLVPIQAGDRLKVGADTELLFLFPFSEMAQPERTTVRLESDQNPISLVFMMKMGGTRWLFTGDIGVKEELELLERWSALTPEQGGGLHLLEQPIDVLKVAHHGSKSSTADPWLEAWRPKQAVISAGANNVYGHPSPQVMKRLSSRGTLIHRTDRHGEVQMMVKEGQISVRRKLE
ncbi:DNA internalization-related competence protein ComEC/Rec2 [Paenibacillus sp. tmac-D7]|uniref:DNA internalization-related competence protein ComEC/Rec2 n=1 Tax=Paenibacillus sp. tmac-D7 TaxID=2591462 RepID=UPI00215B36FF|nr:DNA internalization-related competence protein ComEC/Rec2 [Paenibacillus sp. tmac-D7]